MMNMQIYFITKIIESTFIYILRRQCVRTTKYLSLYLGIHVVILIKLIHALDFFNLLSGL